MGSSDEEDNTSPPKNQQRKKTKSRGSTTLPDIIKARCSGVKKVIEYNERGQPIGVNRAKYASYLGVLARTMVPISIPNWFKVTPELKAKLWSSVEAAFDVDEGTEKKVLSSICEKWRTFKGTLSRHIRNNSSDRELLSKPPKKYSFVEQKDWESFMKQRLSKEFVNLSQDQRNRQRLNKYPCRLSRKGYPGLEEELKKDKNQATQKLDRSFMWKKARQNKKGEYDDDNIAKQAAKIDEITKQVDEGVLIAKGSNDILTMALGKEHPGKVRDVGQFVTLSAFFHVLRRGNHSRCEERQQFLEAMMYQMQAELNALRRHTTYTPPFEHIGSNTLISDDIESPQLHPIVMETRARRKDDLPPPNPNPKVKKSKPCKLAVGSIENIVAHGTMYETVSSDELLGDSNVRVSVDFVIVPYAHLPIPMPGSVTLVGEAVGYQVAWPKNLVLVDDEGTPKHLPKQSNKVRTTDYVPHLDPNPKVKKSKPCKLAVGSIENIVARGTMYERVSSDETIHTLPLGELNVRVSVDSVIIPAALLPIPIPGDVKSVGKVVGYQVAWPKNLVLVDNEGALEHLPKQANKRAPKDLRVTSNEESIELFTAYASLMEYEDTISIILEERIFGVELQFSLTREDMEFICQFQELSISCIMLYVSYLYGVIKETNLDTRFLFVNPSIISGEFKTGKISKATLLSSRL